jgi:hypothetical protein
MIRPFTCLCLLISAGSGLYLYSAKHDAQMLDREITRLGKQAQESRGRAALMRAEYDRLGDPDRLRELASMVLSLQPTDPSQFSSMADLDKRLLAVGATIQPNIGVPAEAPQVLASIAEPPAKAATPPVATPFIPPASEKQAPEKLASEKPAPEKPAPQASEKWITERPIPPIQIAAAKPAAPAPRTAPPQPTALAPVSLAPPASALAVAQIPHAPLVRQAAAETRPAPRPAPTPLRPAAAPEVQAPAPAPVFASALGMARAQAPLPANAITPTSYTPYAPGPTSLAPARR